MIHQVGRKVKSFSRFFVFLKYRYACDHKGVYGGKKKNIHQYILHREIFVYNRVPTFHFLQKKKSPAYFFIFIPMEIRQRITLTKNLESSRPVIERLFTENVTGKLDRYLARFDRPDLEISIELTVEQDKKSLFLGALKSKINGKEYYYSREDYAKLDDLVNHFFDHLKEDLSNK